MQEIVIHTDGGCHGNPGPGAWAYVMEVAGRAVERAGAEPQTTNNRMELTAVIEALRAAEAVADSQRSAVVVYTDSQYVRNGITSWIAAWLRNGWMTASRKPVKNRDLWVTLRELDQRLHPRWEWLRGHAGHDLNERCDQLVQERIRALGR